jgi:hypothetical protein
MLTQYERGIPEPLFGDMLKDIGFEITSVRYCDFTPFVRMMSDLGGAAYGSKARVRVDHLLASAFSFNRKYHRTSVLHRFGPASVFYVLRKP